MRPALADLHRDLGVALLARDLAGELEKILAPWQRRALTVLSMDREAFHNRARAIGRLISAFDPDEPSAA